MGAKKLEPIDWHEFANDAVLNGNMSTLYHRPATEDPSAYASSEALIEIEKRTIRSAQSLAVPGVEPATLRVIPTVGPEPTVGMVAPRDIPALPGDAIPTVGSGPTVGSRPTVGRNEPKTPAVKPTVGLEPTVGIADAGNSSPVMGIVTPTVGPAPTVCLVEDSTDDQLMEPTVGSIPTVGLADQIGNGGFNGSRVASMSPLPPLEDPAAKAAKPTVGAIPTVGLDYKKKIKPIRDVQDALTLAGHVLYKAMFGAPDGAKSKTCAKGYRQLAAETHLDKDTVRDLISEFKEKGIVRETGTYNPDTRSAKTYEVLSYKAILQAWRDAGLQFVTTGRKRPIFCNGQGEPIAPKPTVGPEPTVVKRSSQAVDRPTVGLTTATSELANNGRTQTLPADQTAELLAVLQQITGIPVDQEAADRLMANCRTEAADSTVEEIVEIAWSKAFLCRSGKIENPIGFLITQIPKHFQGEALQTYRQTKRKELEAAAAANAQAEERRREAERETAELEEKLQVRSQIADRHRVAGQGIDLKALLQDPDGDDDLRQWAKRMMKLGHRYRPEYL